MDGRMKTGPRRVGAATCIIRKTNAVPLHMRDGTRELAKLETHADSQNRGYATSLMHQVCREADAARVVLVLWPQPFGDNIALSKAQLAEWYAKEFGFVEIQPEPLLMARQVQAVRPVSFAAWESIQ